MGPLAGRHRRNMRILLAGVVVAVLAVAAALVIAVSTRDASASRGELEIAPEPAPITAAPQVTPVPDDAPLPTPQGIAAAVAPAAANPALGKFSGSVADAVTGQVLWSVTPQTPMTPASTTKVLTAAAALLSLPSDHRVTTKVVQGTKPGEIVLVAGGDPTITAKPVGENGYYPGAAHLSQLVDQIRGAGVAATDIVVDTSIYTGGTMAQGWFPADVGAGFITPTEPIMIDGGRADPLVDESSRTITPALDAGRALARALGVSPSAVTAGVAAPGAATIASVDSAPLRDRLRQMMEHSDNVLAEAIGREVAMNAGADASFAGAVATIGQKLFEAGFDMSGLTLHDASGLSVDDRIAPQLLDHVLTAAAGDGTPTLRPMLDYLPVAGATGSLSDRYASGNRTGAGWVRAKTGTLSTASALAGYVVDQNGRVLTFALMSNDRPPEVSRPALDALAAALRTCGCQ
ncbi:D-alanyl-D-alanine carboxypeptidase/D-alanyl-D-alanine endopeptidase [Rhodococcus tibetensis]|uniref:D-alanyl-D-alanine carboxypeptidase/D-alanyl-D-alanine-endopeptidase n=1 Tax=Rhodococcus tibetensis TaxID=2965064 RepID=A0ABT1QJJ7_9NOCA|nr:D-alanyl-D-alanine carboxypeptidase/D-alanyl-D-alanine-endopeptidase [Rhodococcus sp. FXJ9.536]MCQ4122466.1 D-alanyl-D-alanine carboxypeptidase/D-alanyl-D-alanine-endopeptidase [Rhodococcus sp. FXJ9.536]